MSDEKIKESIKEKIRTIPNWPKEGIMFRDITTLLLNQEGLKEITELLVNRYKDKDINLIAGIESRGFIMSSILAEKLGKGLVLIRKAGKLPGKIESIEYDLEYGKDKIEIHSDAIKKGNKVLLIDDLVATGGTMSAACNLLNRMGAQVIECSCIIDLPDLGGSKKIKEKGISFFSIVDFKGD